MATCLENPRDGGAWWATVYGVARSRTRLTWLSSSNGSLSLKSKLRRSLYTESAHMFSPICPLLVYIAFFLATGL